MKVSARNDLRGTVVDIATGTVMAQVKVDIGGQMVTAITTIDSVADLDLKVGDEVHAIVKASEVILAV